MASTKWYGLTALGQWGATAAERIDWVTDSIKVSLHTSSYAPNQDTDHYFSPSATNEVGASGTYVSGGLALPGRSTSYNGATNEVRLIATDWSATSATITAAFAIIRKDTGTATTSPLMGYVDFAGNVSVTAGTFTIQWDATGALKAVAA
jgi:hypothetical protein